MTVKTLKKYEVVLDWERYEHKLPICVQSFAWDGCHKIYLIENEEQEKEAIAMSYDIYPINKLKTCFRKSCSLKFIAYWDLDKEYPVKQCYKRPVIHIFEL
jgi:hypothetical protein